MPEPHYIYYPERDGTPCVRIAEEQFLKSNEAFFEGENLMKISQLFKEAYDAGATGWRIDEEQSRIYLWKKLSQEEYLQLSIENFEYELKELKK